MTLKRKFVVGAADGVHECPFPGLNSYDMDHRDSFKGRELETIELAQRILASRLTVLTAGSGDGKTSLIHAGLAPLLLSEGYEVAVTEPGGEEPVRAIAGAALERLLPTGGANLVLLDWLGESVDGSTLRHKRDALLKERQKGQRRSPWPVQRPIDLFQGGPIWTWLISEWASDDLINEAMEAVAITSGLAAAGRKWVGVDATADEAREYFAEAREVLGRTWLRLQEQPMQMLDAALEQLSVAVQHRSRRAGFEFILVIDQLEEIFVQYRGVARQGRTSAEPWRHKQALLELILEIEATDWPIRTVLSLRKEHHTDLQTALGEPELRAANTYHLAPLKREQAHAALLQLHPVAVGPGASKVSAVELSASDQEWETFLVKAVDALVAEREGKWVDATELSSFGSWLWQREIPGDAREAVSIALLSQVKSILDINPEGVIKSPAHRQEAIDILAMLIIATEGGEGRRISLPEQAVGPRPCRSAALRHQVLSYLTSAKLLRQEKKDGHCYYEIIHERIIPIVEQLTHEWHDPLLADFGRILESLRERSVAAPFQAPAVTWYELRVLEANMERLSLTDFMASQLLQGLLMLRHRDVATPDEHVPLRDFVRHLNDSARHDARSATTANARTIVLERMMQEELVPPTIAEAVSLPLQGAQARAIARWLIASSLSFSTVPHAKLKAWAAVLTER